MSRTWREEEVGGIPGLQEGVRHGGSMTQKGVNDDRPEVILPAWHQGFEF